MSHLDKFDWFKNEFENNSLNPCCNGCRTWTDIEITLTTILDMS